MIRFINAKNSGLKAIEKNNKKEHGLHNLKLKKNKSFYKRVKIEYKSLKEITTT